MTLSYELIGQRINQFRKSQGLTIEALSERANISAQHCSHICNGKTRLSLTCLVSICNVLSVSPNDILMDNVSTGTDVQIMQDIQRVFDDATSTETRHMLAVASAIKQSLRISVNT